jgi:hypothetical protein
LSIYRVHFKWKDKEIELTARKLDLTHPYFVSIKEIMLPEKSPLIINPEQDDIVKTFGKSNHLMIPFQTVSLIEELDEETDSNLRSFKVVDE